MDRQLTERERKLLLKLARESIEDTILGNQLKALASYNFPVRLFEKGATFVTITQMGNLRGCIGAIEPVLPIVEDVRHHAISAASSDYRFHPVQVDELVHIRIEISRIFPIEVIIYDSPEELTRIIRPFVDGIILSDGVRRATFLPQVWQKLPEVDEFLSSLCLKLGAQADLWRRKRIEVYRYEVEKFVEE